MITFVEGDLLQSKCQALVNAVNCVGVMGGGIALQFRNTFPYMYESYKIECLAEQLRPGGIHIYPIDFTRFILNFATKDHYKDPSQLSWIQYGVENLEDICSRYNIKSVAIPPLGCGLGGLDWKDVSPIITGWAKTSKVDVHIYGKEF